MQRQLRHDDENHVNSGMYLKLELVYIRSGGCPLSPWAAGQLCIRFANCLYLCLARRIAGNSISHHQV